MNSEHWIYISLGLLSLIGIYGLYRYAKSVAKTESPMEVKRHSDSIEIHLFIGS
jgi:hypothetical protein